MNDAILVEEFSTDISPDRSEGNRAEICRQLKMLLADVFALYLKTKSFHWHMTGIHFQEFHLMLDEQASQLLNMTDAIAERARKLGGTTLRSIGDIARHQRMHDQDQQSLSPRNMLAELRVDNQQLVHWLRLTHGVCSQHKDVATTSLIESWLDESEGRVWFLREIVQAGA